METTFINLRYNTRVKCLDVMTKQQHVIGTIRDMLAEMENIKTDDKDFLIVNFANVIIRDLRKIRKAEKLLKQVYGKQ